MEEKPKRLLHYMNPRFLSNSLYFCEICEERPAVHVCKYCKRRVCQYCYQDGEQACKLCVQLRCEVCNSRLAVDKCILCGHLICRSCLREVDEVRRVCFVCYEKFGGIDGIRGELRSRERDYVERLRSIVERMRLDRAVG